jgi:hypothetical protein
MPRRVSMPTADDLFRPTVVPDPDPDPENEAATESSEAAVPAAAAKAAPKPARHTPSGRVRHDEKMTVYVTSDELLDIEHARLTLRRDHSLAVDRGRLVREAVAMVLADLEQQGADSALVRRLTAE